ncbi:hypothetical protein KCU92_g6785, partial [Aureobasidium melanogenum]
MHVIRAIAAAFALAVTVSALPLQKKDDAVVGDPSNPIDDLLTNIKGGIQGFEDFLDIPSGDGASAKAKRAEDIPDAASELSIQKKWFYEGALLTQKADPLVDLAENVKGGFEGFADFLGASGDDK